MPVLAPKPAESGDLLAINLLDVTRIPQVMRDCLQLASIIDCRSESIVNMDKSRFDEAGVVFTCPLLQAAAVCDVIRNHDRSTKEYPTRVYIKKVTAWSKLAGDAVLTVTQGEVVVVNPKIFTVVKPRVIGRALPPPVVVLGARNLSANKL